MMMYSSWIGKVFIRFEQWRVSRMFKQLGHSFFSDFCFSVSFDLRRIYFFSRPDLHGIYENWYLDFELESGFTDY